MTLPIEQMLKDVKIAEECDGLLMGELVVQDLCCHVKALAAEMQRLTEEVESLRLAIKTVPTFLKWDGQGWVYMGEPT